MKELRQIVAAHQKAARMGQKTALVTVVEVEGSAYRREGARMLVDENGQLTGAISGGCLEGDALKKALAAMASGRSALVEWDSRDDDEGAFLGAQLGCRGLIRALIEPILDDQKDGPIAFFRAFLERRTPAVAATFFSKSNRKGEQAGSLFGVFENSSELKNAVVGVSPTTDLAAFLGENDGFWGEIEQAFSLKKSLVLPVFESKKADSVLLHFLRPEPRLCIFGAGNDAQPLVEMAAAMGWPASVVDGRPRLAQKARFPLAERVETMRPEAVFETRAAIEASHFLLMTHNFPADLAIFRQLLQRDFEYVGILGPRKKFEKMLVELAADGFKFDEKKLEKVFAPVGLDIGSGTSEAIALSVMAEILALESGREGGFLRDRKGPVNASAANATR